MAQGLLAIGSTTDVAATQDNGTMVAYLNAILGALGGSITVNATIDATIADATGGVSTDVVAAGAATDTVISAAAGRLCRVLVTTLGTNAMTIYDNATAGSGRIIGIVPASAAAGTVLTFLMPTTNGITVDGHSDNPAVTVSWS